LEVIHGGVPAYAISTSYKRKSSSNLYRALSLANSATEYLIACHDAINRLTAHALTTSAFTRIQPPGSTLRLFGRVSGSLGCKLRGDLISPTHQHPF
jgi:hypothetical protein